MISAATGGHRRPAAGSTGIRPRAVICGLLLSLPGVCGTPLADPAAPDRPYAAPPPAYPAPPPSLLPAGRQEPPAQTDAPRLIDQMPELPALDAEYTEQGEDSLAKRVAGRISDRVWSAGKSLLTPSSLLSTATALRDGNISQRGGQALQNLQDQLFNAVIDAGIDELQRGVEGTFIRNLQVRYQTPFAGRSGTFSVDGIFSIADFERQAIFGQAGALFGDDDGGFNLGLGYRHLLPNDQVLLGINFFYDYHKEAELKRISLGAEAKSTALDAYFNWYRMVGSGNRVGGDIEEYTPDGFDFELAGRVPSLPWVELSGRYYHWFLDDGDTERTKYGDSLTGLRYALTLQPMPIIGLELKLDDPEEGGLDWGVSANLKYRFGVPLHEQLRYQRVKAHDPIHRRFERVRRQYRMLVRRRTPVAPGAAFAFAPSNLRINWMNEGALQLRVLNMDLTAGDRLSFQVTNSSIADDDNKARYTDDYTIEIPNEPDYTLTVPVPDTDPGGASSVVVNYTVPASGLSKNATVRFSVMAGTRQGGEGPKSFNVTVTPTVNGVQQGTVSAMVTVTHEVLSGAGASLGFTPGDANKEVQEPDAGTRDVEIGLQLGPSANASANAPLTLRVRVEPGSTTADCRTDYKYYPEGTSTESQNCPADVTDANLSFTYDYQVRDTANASLKLQLQSDALYKGERQVQLTIVSATKANGETLELDIPTALLIIHEATDELPTLSLLLVKSNEQINETSLREICDTTPIPSDRRAETLTESLFNETQGQVSLLVCSTKPIARDNARATRGLEVRLEFDEMNSTVNNADFALPSNISSLGSISLSLPITIAKDRKHSDTVTLQLEADPPSMQVDQQSENLVLSIRPDSYRYKLGADSTEIAENKVTVTVVDNDTVIGFVPNDQALTEGVTTQVPFELNSNREPPSAVEVWISRGTNDVDCISTNSNSRLTLRQEDSGGNAQEIQATQIGDTDRHYWPVNFASGASTAAFTIEAPAADSNTEGGTCILRVISNSTGNYIPAPEAESTRTGTLTLTIEDPDQPTISFSSDSGSVTETNAATTVSDPLSITITPGTADITCGTLKRIAFGYTYTFSNDYDSLMSLSCTNCSLAAPLSGTGTFNVDSCGDDDADVLSGAQTFPLSLSVKGDMVSIGDRSGDAVTRNVVIALSSGSAAYSIGAAAMYTLTVTEDDMTTFDFQDSTLSLRETDTDFAQTLNVVYGGSSGARDLDVPLRIKSVSGSNAGSSPDDYILGRLAESVFTQAGDCPATLTTGFCKDSSCPDGVPDDVFGCYRIQIAQAAVQQDFPNVAIQVKHTDDDGTNNNEMFILELQPDSNAESPYTVRDNSLTITIRDDEAVPTVSFPAGMRMVSAEQPAPGSDSRDMTIPFSITGLEACQAGTMLSISYTLDGGTAESSDYTDPGSGAVSYTCPGGNTDTVSVDITVSINSYDTGVFDHGKAFTLSLTAGTGYRLGEEESRSATVTLQDPRTNVTSGDSPKVFIDRLPSGVSNLEVSERGSVSLPFVVISPASDMAQTLELNLKLAIAEDTTQSGFGADTNDLLAPQGDSCGSSDWPMGGIVPVQIQVSASQTVSNVSVPLCARGGDGIEGTEYLTVTLDGNAGYDNAFPSESLERTVRIIDPQAGGKPVVYLEMSPTGTSVGEAAGTMVTATVSVNVEDDTNPAVTVASNVMLSLGGDTTIPLNLQASKDDILIDTAAGVGVACSDAAATTNSVPRSSCTLSSITKGSPEKVTFSVVNDEFDEDDETLYVRLEQPAADATYLIAGTGSTRSLTITDDDVITVRFLSSSDEFFASGTTPTLARVLPAIHEEPGDPRMQTFKYNYTGTLAPNVEGRTVNLDIGCGTTDAAFGFASTSTLAPMVALGANGQATLSRVQAGQYNLRRSHPAGRIALVQSPLSLVALRGTDGASADGTITVTAENNDDPQGTQYACLQLGVTTGGVLVDDDNKRYRIEIAPSDLAMVSFSSVAPPSGNNDSATCRTQESVGYCSILEGDTTAPSIRFTIGRTGKASDAVVVGVCIPPAPTDYTTPATSPDVALTRDTTLDAKCTSPAVGHTLSIPESDTDSSVSFSFQPVAGNTVDDVLRKNFPVTLVQPVGQAENYLLGTMLKATVTIFDDDITASFARASNALNEGEDSSTVLEILLNLTAGATPVASTARRMPLYLTLASPNINAALGTTGSAYTIQVATLSPPEDVTWAFGNGNEDFTLQGIPIRTDLFSSNVAPVAFLVFATEDDIDDSGSPKSLTLSLRAMTLKALNAQDSLTSNDAYYKIGGTSSHTLSIIDNDGPPSFADTDFGAPSKSPVMEFLTSDSDTSTVTAAVKCTASGSMDCSTFKVYLRPTEPGSNDEGTGLARYGATDDTSTGGDYQASIPEGTAERVPATGKYVLLGTVDESAAADTNNVTSTVVVTITPEGSASGDGVFEGPENIRFAICVGSLSNDTNDSNTTCAGVESDEVTIKLTDLDQRTLRIADASGIQTTIDDSSDTDFGTSRPFAVRIRSAAETLSRDSENMVFHFTSSVDITKMELTGQMSSISGVTDSSRAITYNRTTNRNFTVTIASPGGLEFNENARFYIPGACTFLPADAVVEWLAPTETRPHYKVSSGTGLDSPGSAKCP